MLPKESQDLIDFVHPEAIFALFHIPDKAKPDTCTHSKFYLREAVLFSFLLDVSR